MFVGACEYDTRVYSTRTGLGQDRALSVRCCAVLCGRVLLTGVRCAVRVYTETCAPHFTRAYVRYGVQHRQPKKCILYVYAFMCACTAVSMCNPSVVPIVVSTCMRACTAFDIYGPSGVLVAQRFTCVYLHSARRVLSEPYIYRVYTVRVPVRCSAMLLLRVSARA